jgi:GAF domain-containing protein
MGLALDLVLEHVAVDRAAIVAIGPERRELLELARRARDGVDIQPSFFDYAIVIASLVKGGAVLNSDIGVDTVSANRPSLHSALCVPLPGQDAALYVDNLSLPTVYSEEDVAFLCQLAVQLRPDQVLGGT